MKSICLENSAATKLLSALMYWYDHSKTDAVNGIFAVKRTQTDLVKDMIDETNVTTIHSIAIPFLQILGYLDIEGKDGTLRYLVYVDRVQAALDAYSNNSLAGFFNTSIPPQLQKFGIELNQDELQKFGFNSKILEKELKKIVIANKETSNCKRGRKPRPKADSHTQNQPLENLRESLENNTKRVYGENDPSSPSDPSAIASHTHTFSSSNSPEEETTPDHDGDVPTPSSNPPVLNTPPQVVMAVETPQVIQPLSSNGKVAQKTTRTKREVQPPVKKDLLAEASPEAQAAVKEWISIFKKPIAITETLIKHAETLAAFQPEQGEITACRLWMYQTDKNKWYSTHGMNLGHVAQNFERFRSLASIPSHNGKNPAPPVDKEAEEARIKANNQKTLEKVQRLIEEKRQREQAQKKGA